MYKHTYNSVPSKGQKFEMASETIQGQALSISQMLERQKNGMPILGTRLNYPDDGDYEPQIRFTDLTDIDDISQRLGEHLEKVEAYKAEFQKHKASKEKELAKKQLLAELKEELTSKSLKATETEENERSAAK